MSSAGTTAYTILRSATNPEPLRGHIGDLPPDVLLRILRWKLLANGEVPALIAFANATPFLVQLAGAMDLLAVAGLDWTSILWQQDVDFWQKFRKLRRGQKKAREVWPTR